MSKYNFDMTRHDNSDIQTVTEMMMMILIMMILTVTYGVGGWEWLEEVRAATLEGTYI